MNCSDIFLKSTVKRATKKCNLFRKIVALDNLDHNPSSTTSQSSFHGTFISIFQFPSPNKPGECRPPVTVPPFVSGKHVQLPEIYTTVPAVAMAKSNTVVPEV